AIQRQHDKEIQIQKPMKEGAGAAPNWHRGRALDFLQFAALERLVTPESGFIQDALDPRPNPLVAVFEPLALELGPAFVGHRLLQTLIGPRKFLPEDSSQLPDLVRRQRDFPALQPVQKLLGRNLRE